MSKSVRNGVTPRRPGEEDGEPTWDDLLLRLNLSLQTSALCANRLAI